MPRISYIGVDGPPPSLRWCPQRQRPLGINVHAEGTGFVRYPLSVQVPIPAASEAFGASGPPGPTWRYPIASGFGPWLGSPFGGPCPYS
jgi:hypothetical protein